MQQASLTLQPYTGRRPIRVHEGTVIAPASNQRWASDGFEIPCWNGEVVRAAFAIDTHDREVMARGCLLTAVPLGLDRSTPADRWVATVGAGISGALVRDMMLECVERRFGAAPAPKPVQWLADNRSAGADRSASWKDDGQLSS